MLQGDVLLAPVLAHEPRRLRRQAEQRFDRGVGAAACAQFQHLAQQDQGRDDGRGFEVDRNHAHLVVEVSRENARREHAHHAVGPGHGDAESDQREHIEVPGLDGLPAADEKWPTAPQHHRRRQQQFEPLALARLENFSHGLGPEFRRHGDDEHREGQQRADPEATCHVVEFAGVLLGCDRSRL